MRKRILAQQARQGSNPSHPVHFDFEFQIPESGIAKSFEITFPPIPERKIDSSSGPRSHSGQRNPISEFLHGIICKISEKLSDKNESLKISDFELIQI